MGHIAIQSQEGCLDMTDLEPFIGGPGLRSEIKWCGEVDITKRGPLQSAALHRQLSIVQNMGLYLDRK